VLPGLRTVRTPFERFFLYSRYTGMRPVGTGLGLAIVDELARAMGGVVDVVSRPGKTRFSIRLPAEPGVRLLERAKVGALPTS
jgi:two-component system sensor histidine kinase BaeS